MTIEQVNLQTVQLLARKAQLLDELKNIDAALGQLAAITQFAKANEPKPEPQAPEA